VRDRELIVFAVAGAGVTALGLAGFAGVEYVLPAVAPLVAPLLRLLPDPSFEGFPFGAASLVAVSLGMSLFTMVALKRETELPLLISGMIVPVVVVLGFGTAVALQQFSELSLVESAVGLGGVLFLLVFVRQMVSPEP
jgi:hypothetical protein